MQATWAIGFAAISSFASAIAVFVSLMQIRKSERMAQVELYQQFRHRFAAPAMNDAIHHLYLWREEFGEGFARIWADRFAAGDHQAGEINRYRRLIVTYVFDIVSAYDVKALTPLLAKRATTSSLTEVYTEICMPMHSEAYGRVSERRHRRNKMFSKIIEVRDRLS